MARHSDDIRIEDQDGDFFTVSLADPHELRWGAAAFLGTRYEAVALTRGDVDRLADYFTALKETIK